jgi:hypothetical protein
MNIKLRNQNYSIKYISVEGYIKVKVLNDMTIKDALEDALADDDVYTIIHIQAG